MKKGLTYRDAGVDIDAGNKAVELLKQHVNRTLRPEVMGDLGSFGGFFAPDFSKYRQPVLVAGTDGVGTKLRVAIMAGKHDSIGQDAVAMCVNDILVQGAEPLFFLDYLAVGRLKPEMVAEIVKGIADGCLEAGCALIGGETAEMPGFYPEDEYDVAGFAVGIVDRERIVNGSRIRRGDQVIGLASSGLHSNGYSLARRVLLEESGFGLDDFIPALQKKLGEEMLIPTRIYVKTVLEALEHFPILGMAHITGGGLVENLPRVLPKGVDALLQQGSWPVPEIFRLIQDKGSVGEEEMYRTFNMGIGLVMVVPESETAAVISFLQGKGEGVHHLGEIIDGKGKVVFR
ncbi:MAG: phosphoribosylformylglycinamidine cyclo-ligase [Bacillota bacterium]